MDLSWFIFRSYYHWYYNFFLCAFSGLDKIEYLQSHENMEIYQKAFDMIEHYFGTEEEDAVIAPQVDAGNQQFQFNAPDQNMPMGGYSF